jgi:hypothetical protein
MLRDVRTRFVIAALILTSCSRTPVVGQSVRSSAADPTAVTGAVARALNVAIVSGDVARVLRLFDPGVDEVEWWMTRVIPRAIDPIEVTVVPIAVAGDGVVARIGFFTARLNGVSGYGMLALRPLYIERGGPAGWVIRPEPPPGSAVAPHPAIERDRLERWRQDIATLRSELPLRHANLFFKLPATEWARALAQLEADLPRLADHQVKVRVTQAVASVGDTHTRLQSSFRSVPLGVHWFSDGLVVTRAAREHAELIGARLVRVGDRPVEEAIERVRVLFAADNKSGVREEAPGYLLSPEVLHALGLSPSPGSARYTLALRTGAAVAVELAWAPPGKQADWAEPDHPAPLRQQRADQPFWYERLDSEGVLYLKYNRCDFADRFRSLTSEILPVLDQGTIRRVVVDLRDNGGGNSAVFHPFLDGLKARSGRFKLYVLIGRKTFSSAMRNALELHNEAHAVLVGEETAGRPNSYGEVQSFRLPHSGLTVQYSTKYWHLDHTADPPSLAPDVPVAVSSTDYLQGRDPEWEVARTL